MKNIDSYYYGTGQGSCIRILDSTVRSLSWCVRSRQKGKFKGLSDFDKYQIVMAREKRLVHLVLFH